MAYKVKLTARAQSDAYAAYEYIRQLAPQAAEKWLKGLFLAISTLDEMPTRCQLIPEANEAGMPISQLLYGERTGVYRIIFDVQEDSPVGPIVRILRIWHGTRDEIRSQDIASED